MHLRPYLVLLLPLVGALTAADDPHAGARAILQQRCGSCHGAEKQKGGLRLDTRAAVLKGGDNGPAAVPGDPERSALVRAVRRLAEPAMPPKDTLPAAEAQALAAWVQAGLPWPGQERQAPAEPAKPTPSASAADEEFFEARIRPLLNDRCVDCHGRNEPKANLQLTARAGILSGGDSGPAAVPGDPARSLLIQAVRHEGKLRMPKGKPKLADKEIADLARWIERGMAWPVKGVQIVASSGAPFALTAEHRAWWSFQPVTAPKPPAVKDAGWCSDDIDRFVLARLEAKGLKPAPPVDRPTLLRRATFDLTGLPPTPAELKDFLADQSPDAFAKVVDRLLASPAYGERWARHWLDGVRFANELIFDLEGNGGDPNLYRDWVIAALNRDMPYDQFVIHQIAGDLLPPPPGQEINREGHIATAVMSMGPWLGMDSDLEKVRSDIVDDQVDLVGRNFLGLTLSCARCHHHKFDPISIQDYYGIAGIFASSHVVSGGNKNNRIGIELSTRAERDRIAAAEQAIKEKDARLKALQKRTPAKGPDGKPLRDPEVARLQAEIAAERKALPKPLRTPGIREGGPPGALHSGIVDLRVHIRGSYKTQGDVVPRRFPIVLAGEAQPRLPSSASGRLELARWIASPANPLTARVMVNRVWLHHLGEGIVRTPQNMGRMGEAPSDPALLDHLAARFVAAGWSLKAMHRAIMLSSTWRQGSIGRPETIAADPENRLFGRADRRRLEAEAIHDSLLAVGGPRPTGERRVYATVRRKAADEFGQLFDAPESILMVARRETSVVAPQALFMLNNPLPLKAVERVAKAIVAEGSADAAGRIAAAHRILFGREPTPAEIEIGAAFLAGGPPAGAAGGKPPRAGRPDALLGPYVHALICANEFIFID